jgi:GxxExxY protein
LILRVIPVCVYEKCFLKELELQGLKFNNQIKVLLEYKGLALESDLRLDVFVEDILCVELKAQEGLLPIHDAVLLSYMKMLSHLKAYSLIFTV